MKYKIFNILLILFIQSCSFYSFKGSIPSHINSVVISPLKNETSEYMVSDILNEKIINIWPTHFAQKALFASNNSC